MNGIRRHRRAVAATFCVLLVTGSASIATAATPVREAEFLEVFGDDHPLVVQLADEVARAEAARVRAGTPEALSLDFEIEMPDDAADQATVMFGWLPPLDGRRSAAIDATQAALEAARARWEWSRARVRQRLRAAFAEWALAHARETLLRGHVESLASLEERLRARADRGEESPLAAGRLGLALAAARADLATARLEHIHALGRVLALREDLPDDAVPVLPDLPETAVASTDIVRADVRAARLDVEAADARARRAGRFLRFPSLGVGWTRLEGGGETFSGPVLGLSWDLPLFDRDQGDRVEATRTRAVTSARRQRVEAEARAALRTAREAYRSLRTSLDTVESAVSGADDVAAAAAAAFLAGESSTTDLLDALRSVLEARRAALDLRGRALEAHRELELHAVPVSVEFDEGDRR